VSGVVFRWGWPCRLPTDAPLVIAVLSNTESVADDIDFETAL
jgi:hypothetical protein